MFRRRVPLLLLILMLAAVPATAEAASLSMREAKHVAAQKAKKVKNDLKSEGARRWKIPGCWRNNSEQVSCYFSIYGYDTEQDFHWKCMLRIVVKKRDRVSSAGTDGRAGSRYRIKYGRAVCG